MLAGVRKKPNLATGVEKKRKQEKGRRGRRTGSKREKEKELTIEWVENGSRVGPKKAFPHSLTREEKRGKKDRRGPAVRIRT